MNKNQKQAYLLIGLTSKLTLCRLLNTTFPTLSNRLSKGNFTGDEMLIINTEVAKLTNEKAPISNNELVNALSTISALQYLEQAQEHANIIIQLIEVGYLRDNIDLRNFFSKLNRE